MHSYSIPVEDYQPNLYFKYDFRGPIRCFLALVARKCFSPSHHVGATKKGKITLTVDTREIRCVVDAVVAGVARAVRRGPLESAALVAVAGGGGRTDRAERALARLAVEGARVSAYVRVVIPERRARTIAREVPHRGRAVHARRADGAICE